MNSGLPNSGRYRGYFGAVESLEVIQQTSGVILAALRVMGEALLCGTEDMDETGIRWSPQILRWMPGTEDAA
jgi:hypothetical protein